MLKNMVMIVGFMLWFGVAGIMAGEPGLKENPIKVNLSTPPVPPATQVDKEEPPQSVAVFGQKPLEEDNAPVLAKEYKPTYEKTESYELKQEPIEYYYEPAYNDLPDPVVITVKEQETDGAIRRLKEGSIQVLTFWRSWAFFNDKYENPGSLQNADGIIQTTDQGIRNFAFRGTMNAANNIVDGAWRIGTFAFPEAQ